MRTISTAGDHVLRLLNLFSLIDSLNPASPQSEHVDRHLIAGPDRALRYVRVIRMGPRG